MKKEPNSRKIQDWLITEISNILEIEPTAIDIHKSFTEYGLSSFDVVSMSGELEDFLGRRLSPTLAYDYPNIAMLTEHLSEVDSSDKDLKQSFRKVNEPMAIIGMGCRFPGANNTDAFWDLLKNGEDRISQIPINRWQKESFYNPDPSIPGKSVSNWGGFMEGIDQFDPFFFGISPKEAKDMDPQQRLLMELSYETLDNAGLSKEDIAGTKTGVFIGISVNEYSQLQLNDHIKISNLSGTGSALSIAANRISYYYNLHGPSMAVDTACSSSLSALHMACQSIRSGESNMALVGGVNLILSPAHSIAFTKSGVLAPDGKCKSFDASANGYVRGEGGGLVIVKPLSDAIAEGNYIYAVIHGSAMNQDGRTNGLMAPNQKSQERMLKEAYANAGISLSQVQYVEAHGSGTLLGDSIEATAIGNVLGKGRSNSKCKIGSVKTNIGHLEAAAGIAGLIKVVLSIENRSLPPSLNFKTPNPHVPFDELNLSVHSSFEPWPNPSKTLVAGISSFGFGGSNVHVVVSEFISIKQPEEQTALSSDRNHYILPLSARDEKSLLSLTNDISELIKTERKIPIKHICHALSKRRNSSKYKMIAMGSSRNELIDCLEDYKNAKENSDVLLGEKVNRLPKTVFVFSGQGGQWLGMGRELIENEPVFYESIKQINNLIQQFYDWSVVDVLMDDISGTATEEIDKVQPAIFAVQIALANLLKSWGISPDAVVGHSMGEVAAAYVAGVLNLEDAVSIICSRSELLTKLAGKGSMMITELSPEEATKILDGYEKEISIAAINGPNSTVLSGDPSAMRGIMAKLEDQNLFCKLIKVNVASHSPQIDLLKTDMIHALNGIHPEPPDTPIYSTVTGSNAIDLQFNSDYWFENLRAPVLFTDAIGSLIEEKHSVFVEIGPHPVLLGSMQQSIAQFKTDVSLLPTLRREENELETILRTVGSMCLLGFPINWDKYYGEACPYVKLPPITWKHERFWIDRKKGSGSNWQLNENAHLLLGNRLSLASSPDILLWQNTINTDTLNFLEDHKIGEDLIFPASGFIEIALDCMNEMELVESHALVDFTFLENLILHNGKDCFLQISVSPVDNKYYYLQIHSQSGAKENWILNASVTIGQLRNDQKNDFPKRDKDSIKKFKQQFTSKEFYNSLLDRGFNYGSGFRGVKSVWVEANKVSGYIELPKSLRYDSERYRFHPALLDSCLQILASAENDESNSDLYLPVSCKKILFYSQPTHRVWSEVLIDQKNDLNADIVEADFNIFNEEFRLIVQIEGLNFRRIRRVKAIKQFKDNIWFYKIDWENQNLRTITSAVINEQRNWLIFSDNDGYGEKLKRMLEASGDHCHMVYANDVNQRINDERDDISLSTLIKEAVDSTKSPLFGIVHLWSLAIPSWDTNNNSEQVLYDLGCNSILILLQTLANQFKGSPQLWLVTKGVQSMDSNTLVSPEQSTLWGLGKVISFELPELNCIRVDLDPRASVEESVSLLKQQIVSDKKEDQVSFRSGRRYVQRILPFPLQSISSIPEKKISAQYSYLIAGGLGGLGLETANWLAKKGARNLILGSRREPSVSVKRNLDNLKGMGVQIMVKQVDICEKKQVDSLFNEIQESMPELKGIIHSAGILDDGPLVNLNEDRMKNVMRTKVEGTWNLHQNSLELDLDHFILYSSAVSVLGSPGQGNYSAASTYLDCMAHYRHSLRLPAISVNWGPWADVGLAVEASEKLTDQDLSTDHLVKMIEIEQGFEVLDLL
ncbi:MAG: SDR family NAD(P)-dependent oxidoreductase, partial [Flavobacteriaceae bacterium]|nr:SDR family NAD(P)-dependent oxidoreductase [Flavobacteriaceae bacterium]